MRVIIPILLISILILGGSFFTTGNSMESEERDLWNMAFMDSYITHEPIRVNNDTDFRSIASAENWSGDGTYSAPFIIENYSISGEGYNYGIYIGNTTLHFIVRNCYINHAGSGSMPYFGGSGIILYNVSNATIMGNRLESNSRSGIYADMPHNLTIISNQISSNHYGAFIFRAHSDTLLFNNTFHVNRFTGVYIHSSTGVEIRNNTFRDNRLLGIYLYVSTHITLQNNTFEGAAVSINGYGDSYWNTHNIDTSNTVNDNPIHYIVGQTGGFAPKDSGEIILASTTDFTVEDVNIGHTSISILVGYSERIAIKNSTVDNDTEYGIYLFMSDDSLIENTSVVNNFQGINIDHSQEISLKNNTFRDNLRGLYLFYSQEIELHGNTFKNNNIIMDGNQAAYWDSHIIDNTNLANSKPIIYITQKNGGNITGNLGELIIASSSNMMVENVTITGGDCGLVMGFSSHLTVRNSTFISQGYHNILGEYISSSTFFGIVAENGEIYGATFRYSDNNLITNSSFSENLYGMNIYRCNDNVIRNNTFRDNFFNGIRITFSQGNHIYHNNFLDNNPNAYDSSKDNFWNATSPIGGNYWSDYTGEDNNNDGFGDSPYTSGNVVDNYPLMEPVNNVIPEITWFAMLALFILAIFGILRHKGRS